MSPKHNTISTRNHKSVKEAETLLWRALCDDMEDAKEYISPDCIMMNPFISDKLLSKDGTSVHKALDDAKPFQGYKMKKDKTTVEVDMMSMHIIYHASITSPEGEEFDAACSSTWKQTAGGDWRLCAMLVAPDP